VELRSRHNQEVNDFPFFFAFSDEQFIKGMASFGLTPDDTDKIYGFSGTGGYYLRSDAPRLNEMFERHNREREEAIAADTKGTGYIYQMFMFELANHEYGWTWDESDTLDALDLTWDEINKNKALANGLKKAAKEIRRRAG
jgi:hypothetical protein